MGNLVSCVSSRSSPPPVTCNVSRIRNTNLPIIWITGQQNTGKKTLGQLIKDSYEFEYINISDLLKHESSNDTKRGQIVHESLKANKKINDIIVMDLLKEALMNSTNDKGFLIVNFPRNPKQADRFIRDIANVNFIFYFYSEIPILIERAQEKSGVIIDPVILRRDIAVATRDLKMCLSKFSVQIESINTSGMPEETFVKVENALIRRINLRPIKTETDYVQPKLSKTKQIPAPPPLNYTDEQGTKEKNLIVPVPKESIKLNASQSHMNQIHTDKPAGDLKKRSSSKVITNSAKKEENKIEENEIIEKADSKRLSSTEKVIETKKINEVEQSAEDDDSISLDF